jgi:acylglycerol lipase
MGRVPGLGTDKGVAGQRCARFLTFPSRTCSIFKSTQECGTHDYHSTECDLVFCHGINDYGGKFAVHADHFLDAGVRTTDTSSKSIRAGTDSLPLLLPPPVQYRVVVPDLPGHGRSTGIHVYTPRMEALADAVYAVIKDVALQDSRLVQEQEGSYTQTRKVFVAGQSLGGFTATLTCL